jgi:hypothetical protein
MFQRPRPVRVRGRETIIVTRREGMAIWREKLFVLMAQCGSRHGFLPATT